MSPTRRSIPDSVDFAAECAVPVVGLRARLRRAAAVVRRIIGVPDYDAYLAHMQRQFPDCTPLDPRTFERERLADKYTQPGSRCC